MVDLEQIKVVLQGISAVAALIKLRRETQKAEREPTPAQIDGATRVRVSTVGFDTLAAAIQQSTLDAISDVIDRARKRLDEALRDPANTKQSRDSEEQIAQSTICGELKRIKRLNGGALPGEYGAVWDEFACA